MNWRNPVITRLKADLEAARVAYDKQEYAEAKQQLDAVRAAAEAVGLRSPVVAWLDCLLASAADDVEQAFALVCEVIVLDPMHPAGQGRFVELGGQLREVLAASSREEADELTPRVHAQLEKVGETDASSHVALARYLKHRGMVDEAVALLDAVTLLAPSEGEAWRLRGEFAVTAGDAELARTCERRAAEADLDTPFAGAPTATC
jgi:tetratricopeptide (TPR) repeat protein